MEVRPRNDQVMVESATIGSHYGSVGKLITVANSFSPVVTAS
jgi:hypothetical protein